MDEPFLNIPFCPPAADDTIPMLVVAAVFLVGGWLIRCWRKKRKSEPRK